MSEARIQQDIRRQVDVLFEQIKVVIDQSTGDEEKIEAQIAQLWQIFYGQLGYFLHQTKRLSRYKQRPYIHYSEKYFQQCREAYTRAHPQGYQIRLHPNTQFVDPPPRKIISTHAHLGQGRVHGHLRQALYQQWCNADLMLNDVDLLWGYLYLSLIYYSGCHQLQHLTAIGQLLNTPETLHAHLLKLYRADYKKIINPLLLSYRVTHRYYGNVVEDQQIYQWRQIWLNPYALWLLQKLQSSPSMMMVTPRTVLEALVKALEQLDVPTFAENLRALVKLKRLSDVHLAEYGKINAFEHVQFCLESNEQLDLDMCLSQVLQQNLKTVALSLEDQHQVWLTQNVKSQVLHIPSDLLAVQFEHPAAAMAEQTKMNKIPLELILFEKQSSRNQQKVQKKGRAAQIQWMRWRHIEQRLKAQQEHADGKARNLIEAQLRLLAWMFALKQENKKLSSIQRYLSSFAKDYLFHIYLYEDDVRHMSAEDHDQLYQDVLHDLDQRDHVRGQTQGRAHYAFGRLKAFHAFCTKHFALPAVSSFQYSQFQRIELCQAKWITPRLWSELKQQLMLRIEGASSPRESRELKQLMAMYILAYRLGLRLNEVRCLTLSELICPEVLWKGVQADPLPRMKIILRNHVYRRLKSHNAKRQLDLNLMLTKDEMVYILTLVKPYLKARQSDNETLLFGYNGQLLSEQSIQSMTKILFTHILPQGQGYSFHSLRHSAANQLAIAWFGSKALVKTYSDYSWQQVKAMRKALFGEQACQNAAAIQYKWRMLADWMGHCSIEQTAAHYLHVLDLLAVDRIGQQFCGISDRLVDPVGRTENVTTIFNLARVIQKQAEFSLYHRAKGITTLGQMKVITFEAIPQHQAEAILLDYLERGSDEIHCYHQRAFWLAMKLMQPACYKMPFPADDGLKHCHPECLETLYRKVRRRLMTQQLIPLSELKQHRKMALFAIKMLIRYGKVRKNFIHFQCRTKADQSDWNIERFIEGMNILLPEQVRVEVVNYPVNLDHKSREIKLSMIESNANKNVSLLIIFRLIAMAVEQEDYWE